MKTIFGTDGVRGPVGTVLTPELAFKLGRAAGDCLLTKLGEGEGAKTVVIGRDTRLSGPMLEAAIAAGFMSVGVHVISVGVIPTPGVAHLVRAYHAMAGVVISASHNPYEDNGIKFFNHEGRKLDDDLELAISQKVLDPSGIRTPSPEAYGTILREDSASGLYGDMLKGLATFTKPFKVVVDCGHGSASLMAGQVLTDLGLKVTMMGDKPDGVNINEGCGSTHTEGLQEAVRSQGADLGLAFDGDADRFLAVDHQGNLVDGDQLMAIYALWLKDRGQLAQDSLVITVMSNLGLKKAMEAAGIRTLETKVGDRYVTEAMESQGLNLGGEQSGHIIFADANTTGDGLTSALMLLNIMDDTGKSLADLAQAMTVYPQVLVNVKVSDKTSWESDPGFQEALASAEEDLAGSGRILVRASGTENLLRVMVEGQDQDQIDRHAKALADYLDQAYGL